MLEAQRDKMELLAYDYSWWDDAVRNLVETPDPDWADGNVGSYQYETNGIGATFVVAPDGETVLGFVGGAARARGAYAYFGAGLRLLVERARAAPPTEPVPASGYLQLGDGIHIVSAAALTHEYAPDVPTRRGVLIFSQPLDAAFLLKGGEAYGLRDLAIEPPSADPPPASLALSGPGGKMLGLLTWSQDLPGDDLALQLAPALAAIVVAMALLLYIFFRRAEVVLANEAELIDTLRSERELTALKTDIMTVLAHELRLPLSHVRNAADTMRADARPEALVDHRREIDDISHAVARLDRWVDNAMVLGRPDAGFQPMARERVGLPGLIRGAWDETRYLTEASRPFLFAHDVDQADTRGDAFLLRAALVNVLENAIKFSGAGDPIVVHLGEAPAADGEGGARWEITVRDRGPGVPPAELETIFDPFRRAKGSESVPGSGLGLAVARSMIERCGGSIAAANHHEGGAVFTIRLPRALPSDA
jgi:signal transduction histidine kinase